jgi:hypothetical protein
LAQVVVTQCDFFKVCWSFDSARVLSKLQLDILAIIFTLTSGWDCPCKSIKINVLISKFKS